MAESSSSSSMEGVLTGIKKRWFIIAVVFVIATAHVYPSFGAKSGQQLRKKVELRYANVFGGLILHAAIECNV